jgi:thymidylate kinase
MLQLVRQLLAELDARGVRYCHWKSNATLDAALDGIGDLDLLVHTDDGLTLDRVLSEFGFVEAVVPAWRARPGAQHHYGLDQQSGALVHIDLYEQLLTGGTLLKNHHLPLEAMVFANLRRQSSVPVPSHAVELVLLVVRKALECASVPEYALLLREHHHIRRELEWLADDAARTEAHALLRAWLPSVDPLLFDQCMKALAHPRAMMARFRLGRRLTRQLRNCEQMPGGRAELVRWARLARWALKRLGVGPQGMPRARRGVIVAFVGPEGSGKSTLVRDTAEWLGEAVAVRSIHVGKPPPSLLSVIPNLLAPAMRALLPRYRSTNIEAGGLPASGGSIGFWLYMYRCLGLAFDRWLLLRAARRQRNNGVVVVCDRYPSLQTGFVDSPQLQLDDSRSVQSRVARLEHRLYRDVPPADLVINCEVPLEDALRRNTSRRKKGGPEPEDFVRYRHAQFARSAPSVYQAQTVDTTTPPEHTRLTVRKLVWRALVSARR